MISILCIAILLGSFGASAQENPRDTDQPFHLAADGDFRVVAFTVRQTPEEVDCHFEVLQGNPSVHVELIPISELRLLDQGLDHDSLVVTPESRTGDFRRMIDVRGRYAVVVKNGMRAPAAMVSLQVRTTVNPDAKDIARTLSPERRLAVILISFAFFFATVTWSARKLIRGMRS